MNFIQKHFVDVKNENGKFYINGAEFNAPKELPKEITSRRILRQYFCCK